MKILVIQNKMGIGDMVIYLPFIEAISKTFNTPVSILVKESSKAEQFLKDNNIINKIIILDRNNKFRNGKHDGFIGFYNLARELKQHRFDKVFIFNSSLRFNLIARFADIKDIYQYPLFKKKGQHIMRAANEFLNKKLNLNVESDPKIFIKEVIIKNAKLKYDINTKQINILLGIGGSGPNKRVSSKTYITFMNLVSQKHRCKFFLATGKNIEEQKILNELLVANSKYECYALDNLSLNEILPIIKSCDVSICNDSSFSHLSSGLGVDTIVLIADTPLLYGNYSSRMFPIIPDKINDKHPNALAKDRIDPNKILEQFNRILN